MVRIYRPEDVPSVNLTNEVRVTRINEDPTNAAMVEFAERTRGIVDAARDQQIENEVRLGELQMRERLDKARQEAENNPDYESMPDRWNDLAAGIDQELSERFRAPAARALWRERADAMLSGERRTIFERTQMRAVETARAGLITNLGEMERAMTDPDATEETRNLAYSSIERALTDAALRRTIGVDDAARMLESARGAQETFRREVGLRQQAQQSEDQIFSDNPTLAVALERAREIENPLLRDAVTNRVEARYSQQERERDQNVRNALSTAVRTLENGGSLLDIPAGTRAFLVNEQQWDNVRSYAESMASNGGNGPPARVSEARADALMVEALSDPRDFAVRTDIATDPNMNADDRARVMRYQAYLRGDEPMTEGGQTLIERGYADTIATATRYAEARGVDICVNGGSQTDRRVREGNQRRARFEQFIMGATRRFIEENGRAPRPNEQEEIARAATMGVRSGGDTEFVYQTGQESGRRVRVPLASIPQWEVNRLSRVWMLTQNNGAAPSTEQRAGMGAWIEGAYAQELAEGGR